MGAEWRAARCRKYGAGGVGKEGCDVMRARVFMHPMSRASRRARENRKLTRKSSSFSLFSHRARLFRVRVALPLAWSGAFHGHPSCLVRSKKVLAVARSPPRSSAHYFSSLASLPTSLSHYRSPTAAMFMPKKTRIAIYSVRAPLAARGFRACAGGSLAASRAPCALPPLLELGMRLLPVPLRSPHLCSLPRARAASAPPRSTSSRRVLSPARRTRRWRRTTFCR